MDSERSVIIRATKSQ